MSHKVGLIGARGYTGAQLLRLIAGHPDLELAFASSREFAGQPIADIVPEVQAMDFTVLDPAQAAHSGVDVCVLALPNGVGGRFVDAFDRAAPETVLIDLSADFRFTTAWSYGLPELYRVRENLRGARRIANPGCYATAAQIAIFPALSLLTQPPCIFGVSGYSGAGTTPSPNNDTARLADNLIPYTLSGHLHEQEMTRHLGQEVYFTPHMHPAFSGSVVTVHLALNRTITTAALQESYHRFYADEPLIRMQSEVPTLKDGAQSDGVVVGGFSVSADGRHAVIVSAADNLRKGAAIQALQNINLALGLDEFCGIAPINNRPC